ncbi:uncharacterized protein Z519_07083 [Cladophialophora bantiana CBS 173.52]|uniref:Transcription factor domain-containing protein n=1 Tax=Cladophialophora bantiana (strain ATCC 10958 / CBS 173.52 / CDC B-1940 / NIH 8579) TaxID=1442370 RepID=A0A0D2I5D3_CLAB1|nr:uncharacterized protein Z519_07083 [Cladophialophora bantiana CBS 173.52]KIW92099.1 hypothetical protein Z519_07083 [Cladophialophora bantiana CBS 173.52]
MATEQLKAGPEVRFSSSRQWPGERHPTRWDVHDANESPAITFLDRFRAALLHTEGAEDDASHDVDSVIDSSENMDETSIREYTYPVVMLSEVPIILPEEEMAQLQQLFFASFNHIFINAVDVANWPSNPLPPYLQYALACLGAAAPAQASNTGTYTVANGTDPADVAAGLFIAGARLWSVMLEVDNREARMLEAVIAASLLITYGVLSTDRAYWRMSSVLLCNVVTISRRLHLPEGCSALYTSSELPEKDVTIKSSLMSYLLLLDTIHAVHYGLAPHFSRTELFIRMPSSNHQFRTLYNSLTHGYALPQDVRSREDSLLLLTVLLSDTIYTQRCHFSMPFFTDCQVDVADKSSSNRMPLRNPYVPLTSQSEYSRLSADLLAALCRWEQHFQRHVGTDVLAFFYFVKLQLMCPELGKLPRLAGYGTASSFRESQRNPSPYVEQIDIPDKAMELAWLVLDHCDGHSQAPERRLAVWLPVILFLSALVAWQKLHSRPIAGLKYGSLKVLGMYRDEIAKLPWPCCVEMTNTLDRLMKR